MGRNVKHTLFYSPLYCDFWDRHDVICIEEEEGIIGSTVALRIRSMIFQENGYYIEWPDRFEYTIAKRVGNGITGADVMRIFNVCLKHGFFDQQKFDNYRIITSGDIQATWLEVMRQCRRVVSVSATFWLISSEGIGISSEEIGINAAESTQKEVIKKVSNKESGAAEAATPVIPVTDTGDQVQSNPPKRNAGPRKTMIPPTLDQCLEYFMRQYNPKNPGTWYPDKCRNEGTEFYNHYTANGWRQGKGTGRPIVNWESAAANWISREKKGIFREGPATAATPAPIRTNYSQRSDAQMLPQIERDINYCYNQFCDNPEAFNLSLIVIRYYDHMKGTGMTKQLASQEAQIQDHAVKELNRLQIELNDEIVMAYKKRFAVLELFNRYRAAKEENIFFLKQ